MSIFSKTVESQSEERFRDFAQIAADWFWETDLEQVFTYISPAPNPHGNWRFEALLGQRWRDHAAPEPPETPETNAAMLTRLQTYMDGAEAFDDVVFVVGERDEPPIHISVAGKPMYDRSAR